MTRAAILLSVLLAACGSGAKTPSPGATSTVPPKAAKAAAVAKELKANPDDADAILGRHGMTQQQFEDLMFEIAADEELTKAYEQALAR